MVLSKQIKMEDVLRARERYTEHRKIKEKKKEINILDTLNTEQLEAVKSGKKNALVVASAGTGKTSTIIGKVVNLLNNGINPKEIILLTFTSKAGVEMLERLNKYFPKSVVEEIFAGTFHSYGAKLLKDMKINRKLKKPKEISLFFESIVEPFNLTSEYYSTSTILEYINLYENTNTGEDFNQWFLSKLDEKTANIDSESSKERVEENMRCVEVYQKIYESFCTEKKVHKICDFNDLLKMIIFYYQKNQNTLKQVIVDEYQDTNNLQNKILKFLEATGTSIFAVGDYDQSIYGFNGSNVYLIKDFVNNYGGNDKVGVYKLCRNYRSSEKICKVANTCIEKNERIIPKELIPMKKGNYKEPEVFVFETREEQLEYISNHIVELSEKNISLNDIAILFRTNNSGNLIEPILIKNNIPTVRTKNSSFFDGDDIACLVSVLRIISNKEKSIMEYLHLSNLIEGLSKEECKEIYGLKLKHDDSLKAFEEFNSKIKNNPKDTNVSIENWESFMSFIIETQGVQNVVTIFKLLYETKCYGYLFDSCVSKASKFSKSKEDNEIIEQISKKHNLLLQIAESSKNINTFLLKTTFSSKHSSNSDDNEEYGVNLLTVHASKGLEFKIVFIIDLIEKVFPNTKLAQGGAGIDEERRLMYVAITRAKENLYMCYFKKDTKGKETTKSRFIQECGTLEHKEM